MSRKFEAAGQRKAGLFGASPLATSAPDRVGRARKSDAMSSTVLATTFAALALGLAGCQAYSDFRTLVANNFQNMRIEVAPEVSRVAKVENVSIKEKQGARGFWIQGEVSHGSACQLLNLDISFVSVKGVVLRNSSVGVPNYPGKSPARFETALLVDAKIGSSDDVVDKVLFTQFTCR